MSLAERFRNGWDAFLGRDQTWKYDYGQGSSYRPDRVHINYSNMRSIVSSIQNRIAVDAAQIDLRHIRMDDTNQYYKETIDDPLNYCLTRSANIDQSGRAMIKDAVFSLLDEGCVALVPTMTSNGDPYHTEAYNIQEIRTAKIIEWFPDYVRVDIYNDRTGQHVQMMFPKKYVVIVENPFYQIMNETNSTMSRLKRTMATLDKNNDMVGNDKLNMIIRLPYALNSKLKEMKVKQRIKELDDQLASSKLGIGWIDATEQVIQLNRSLENNLWTQVRDLQEDLFNEMGVTQSVFDGTADEQTMLNYNNRTIEPILTAITEEMERKWLSRTAITQHQAITFYRDPFKLVPVGQIADIADKFTRNEIMTSNELRAEIGMLPAKDPKADELWNSNLNHPDEKLETQEKVSDQTTSGGSTVDVEEIVSRISK